MRVSSLRIPGFMARALERAAKASGIAKSAYIRRAITRALLEDGIITPEEAEWLMRTAG